MINYFKITLKHYRTIVKQGLDNLPMEAGGFVGGRDGVIRGILPLYNMHLYDKTGTFTFTGEDVERAHAFCKKHNLEYYGLYHTHPKGVAYPSDADIQTGMPYHFILSLRNPESPEFAAYRIEKNIPIQVPLEVIPDTGYESISIHDPQIEAEVINPFKVRSPKEDAEHLSQLIQNMKEEKQNDYPKMPPKHSDRSDFSTLA